MSNKTKRLTRKQLVQHIAEKMPEGLTELEKAAFIEVEVAKRMWFNEEYLWGKESEKIYKAAKREACKPKQEVKRKLICVTMAELYVYVAKQFGLNVKFQRYCKDKNEIGEEEILGKLDTKSQEHLCPVLQLSDGRTIRVDIQGDLHNLQTRSRPDGFGTSENDPALSILPQKQINEIFKKAYDLKEGEYFTDEYITRLNSKLSHREPIDKIRIFMEDSRIQDEMKKLGCVEARKFCKQILQQILGISMFGTYFHNGTRAHITKCFLANQMGEKRYSICLYAEDYDQKIFYILSKKNRQMVEISPEQLSQMLENSMVIPQLDKKNQDNLLQTVLNGILSYPAKSSQTSNTIDMESFFQELEDYEEEK